MVEIVLEPVLVQIVLRSVEACRMEHRPAGDPLVLEVMECIADPGVSHPEFRVNFVEKDRDYTGLPIMAVYHIGMLAGLKHEFERCPRKKSKALRIVVLAIVSSPA